MYCNKVKKGKRCITYTLQFNLTKLNLDHSSSVRRIFQFSVVKTLPYSGCFTACMSGHFPIVMLIRWLTVRWFQMGLPIDWIPAHIIMWDWSVCMLFWYQLQLWPILTIIYVIWEIESVMIFQFVEILQFSKVLISLVWTQFKPF